MDDQVIPNTDNRQIACLAIAWEIVRKTGYSQHQSSVTTRKQMTNDVIEISKALFNEEPIEDKSPQ